VRVLYYNWVDYLDEEKRGGGVSVYLKNLMAEMSATPNLDAVFLSSGISYDLFKRTPRWEPVRHGPLQDRHRRYEIVNSGVLAPAHHSFGANCQISHSATRKAFFDFVEKTGPYDVIHFHNLEGLPADVLEVKAQWPRTKVLLSMHNYYPMCPQVNLWHKERLACTDYEGGRKCIDCLLHKHDERLVRMANAVAYRLKCSSVKPGSRAFDLLFRQYMRLGSRATRAVGWVRRKLHDPVSIQPVLGLAGDFASRRALIVRQINTNCDFVLCVSDRVREVADSHGIDSSLMLTSYIGTQEAERFAATRATYPPKSEKNSLTLAYLGYMRRDKGFYFLLDALKALPQELATRVHLIVAAHSGPPEAMAQLAQLKARLGDLVHINGYKHDQLDSLLKHVDIGLVPVLWEDNLPQVAIEMHARHIPVLTSNLGGARELSGCPDMVFAAGDTAAFVARVQALLDGAVDFDAYWRSARAPQTMARHLAELESLYSGEVSAPVSSVVKPAAL
jgi:glycosyltransferase involved in cell wall biosynthesis